MIPNGSATSQVVIVDYGMGNLRSVEKAFEHLGIPATVGSEASILQEAASIILPGVGAFGDAMREMGSRGITGVLRDRAREASEGGRPFLGICLGMQVLVNDGEEDPGVPGLGVIQGSCPRIAAPGMKVPHMGWNELEIVEAASPLLVGLGAAPHTYFVHSFHVVPDDRAVVAAWTDYGGRIAAALACRNLFATQFHPEKSQAVGLQILANFARASR